MKLHFSGAPEITSSRSHVWKRLLDPNFVAKSAPGVESVEAIDPTHYKVISAFGVGALQFMGVQDNTDVFFKLARCVLGGY